MVDTANTREQILDAARDLFVAGGVRGVSMRKVAGSSPAQVAPYRYKIYSEAVPMSNAWDVFIIINWAIIGVVRFGCILSPASGCSDNNGGAVTLHMFVFCIQIVILWSRIALIFKTNRVFGPFLLMIPAMIKDIINWVFVLSIFFVGFAFGAHFLIAGDISYQCADAQLDTFSLVFEYVFVLLMGDSEWSDLEPNACLGQTRSILLKIFMWCFSLLGTIILLNLLIAMMGYTYGT